MNNSYNCQTLDDNALAQLDVLIGAHSDVISPPRAPIDRPLTLVERLNLTSKIASISEAPNPPRRRGRRASPAHRESTCPARGTGDSLSSLAIPSILSPFEASPSPSTVIADALKRKDKAWRDASEEEKFDHAVKVVRARDGYKFDLDLSQRAEEEVVGAVDPIRTFARRLQRAFIGDALLVPPFAFVLESSPAGRAHIHGVLIAGGIDRDRLVKLLMGAGGKIHGRSASRQLKLEPLLYPVQWCGYVGKAAPRTKSLTGAKRLTYLSNDLRRLTKRAWIGS
jgi:hypothetical protein